MSVFEVIIVAAQAVVAVAMIAGVVLMLRVKDSGSRAILSDLVFLGLLASYVLWSLTHETQIAYEIMLLGTLGCLSTISLARILSNGRR
ncbi:cation:proton antiporter [Corynebacterium aquilae DSM 44791]|uniref:Cation:proton antiporter n=2 Tax=Corynebacterium aquilae TaxID=203263 RepID=A0A1L7CDE3_9CORY|nr:cation:proton antiporter [Corynebacterium aquilae DSM 44791]